MKKGLEVADVVEVEVDEATRKLPPALPLPFDGSENVEPGELLVGQSFAQCPICLHFRQRVSDCISFNEKRR